MSLVSEILQIFFGSMVPILEQRAIIPYFIVKGEINDFLVIFIALLGNFLIGIIVYLIISPLIDKLKEYLLARFSDKIWIFNIIVKMINYLFNRAKKNADKIDKTKFWGLVLFVGIPLPFTGVWTGALAAYLFKLNKRTAILGIAVGLLLSATIVGGATITGSDLFSSENEHIEKFRDDEAR